MPSGAASRREIFSHNSTIPKLGQLVWHIEGPFIQHLHRSRDDRVNLSLRAAWGKVYEHVWRINVIRQEGSFDQTKTMPNTWLTDQRIQQCESPAYRAVRRTVVNAQPDVSHQAEARPITPPEHVEEMTNSAPTLPAWPWTSLRIAASG